MVEKQMIRDEKQMRDEEAIDFLLKSKLGRLGVYSDGEPYIVPVLYDYDLESKALFIHCAKKGRKLDAIRLNGRSCFEVDEINGIISANTPCDYELLYRSVIAFGNATIVEDTIQKAEVLNRIMKKYSDGQNKISVTPGMAERTMVIRIGITSLKGKEGRRPSAPYP
ncbi:MAG: pyridoxamine 5'-phosphate oxidase family protein [Candidatus Methanomethylicus sp.]|nr:pyridoxamine 5'-phosphate oxidase family protein [Candidatus Methanomethylicus sp.]